MSFFISGISCPLEESGILGILGLSGRSEPSEKSEKSGRGEPFGAAGGTERSEERRVGKECL